MNRLQITLGLVAAAVLVAGTARAATDTGNVAVSATVPASCVVGDANLSFGLYDPLTTNAAAPLDASAPLVISCTGGTVWTIGLSNGANFGATRQMASGANRLAYELYRDAPGGSRWGDLVSGQALSGTMAVTGTQILTIHGRIPAAQLVAAGTYTDTVVATIQF